MISTALPTLAERADARAGWSGWIVTALLFAAVAWAWHGTGFDLERLAASPPRIAAFLSRMVPPDLSVANTVLQATIETLQIAFLGTVLSAIASLGLGLLAAATLTPRWVHEPMKWLLGAIRGVPLVLVYSRNPDVPPRVLPEQLTPGLVMDALEWAGK